MKLYFICPEMNGYGGTETVVGKVTSFLADHGYNVRLILTSKPQNTDWINSISDNVQITRVMHNKLGKATGLIAVFHAIQNNDKVIILAANVIPFAKKFRNFFYRKWEIISWIHYSLTHQNMFDPHNLIFADEHWAISSSIKNQLLNLGVDSSRIKLIFNPIDEYNGKLNCPYVDNEIKIMFVGRILFEGQKNLRDLLKAIVVLKKHGHRVRAHFYGVGPDLQRCQLFAKQENISDCIIWHGWTKDVWSQAVDHIHPQALVMTSKFEGLPMVMLEAISHGIPCITSRFDGYTDVLLEGINGFSYVQGNIQMLARRILYISRNNFVPEKVSRSIKRFYTPQYFARLKSVLGDRN